MRQALLSAVCSLSLFAACGGGGGDDGATIDAPSGNPDSAVAQLSCATYCASITTNCTGANLQYASADTCMASCATWMTGTTADMVGNTLGCRTYHAGAAAGSPGVHCVHAGPSGGSQCGMPCEGFCTLVQGVCTGANQVYADPATCATACAAYNPDPAYTANVVSGNSLSCRIYHATAASTSAGVHCPHTAAISSQCQ